MKKYKIVTAIKVALWMMALVLLTVKKSVSMGSLCMSYGFIANMLETPTSEEYYSSLTEKELKKEDNKTIYSLALAILFYLLAYYFSKYS